LSKIYYVDNTLSITETTTVDVPDSGLLSSWWFSCCYTNYADIVVSDTIDLIISDGDELVLDMFITV
jgi:hypothetical protein